ncbi:MAG: VWA domain-containing protein [Planctomycetes bacterium]|nr:VWA domain-containing protein [Planctomycetota bacterium]
MPSREQAPELPIEWEEKTFKRLWKWLGRFRPEPPPKYDAECASWLKNHQDAFAPLAQVFAGRPVVVREAEDNGGVRGRVLSLPKAIDRGADAQESFEFFTVRVAIAAALAEAPSPANEREAMIQARAAALTLSAEYPGFSIRYEHALQLEIAARPTIDSLCARGALIEAYRLELLHHFDSTPKWSEESWNRASSKGNDSPGVALWGGWLSPSEELACANAAAADKAARESEEGVAEDATEKEAPIKDEVHRTMVDEESEQEAMPEHVFEKVESLDNFAGNMRHMDGADDLEDHQEALDELDLRELIRGGPEVHSVYRADLDGATGVPDVHEILPSDRGQKYDEWDEVARAYRRNWVTVYPTVIQEKDAEWGANLRREMRPAISKLTRRLEAFRTERANRNRLLDGPEIDLSSVIEDRAEVAAGQPSKGRFYADTPRVERDLATTVLLDLSLSADSWIDNRRVLDVAREAVMVLGEAADKLGDQLQVIAFASNTRNLCRAWEIKGWREPWALGRARLGGLKPQGYTRIGPALRHATAELAKTPARRKHLILISDGKPTDFDRYEGAYGLADVRQATREARADGIRVHMLGIDPKAAGILPNMFGVGGWEILRHIKDLPECLVAAYGKA